MPESVFLIKLPRVNFAKFLRTTFLKNTSGGCFFYIGDGAEKRTQYPKVHLKVI